MVFTRDSATDGRVIHQRVYLGDACCDRRQPSAFGRFRAEKPLSAAPGMLALTMMAPLVLICSAH